MTIDRKFEITAVNPVSGNTYTEQNALLLCAKDRAVPAALKAYKAECERLGASAEHVESVGLLIERVEAYQKENPTKVPDTEGAEIDRCLKGIGV